MKKINWEHYIKTFNNNDEELNKQLIDNDHVLEWMQIEIPKFECSDKTIEETYYFRWWTFRKHIKNTPEGKIITEFLPDVEWAGRYNSINAAMSHHLSEARWLKNGAGLIGEYLDFWLLGSGNACSYSSWMIYAIYEFAILTNNKKYATSRFKKLMDYFDKVHDSNYTVHGLYWSYDDRDAMEYSVSGSGLRPTLNSYMYANAYALSEIASWAGRDDQALRYAGIASDLKVAILAKLWDSDAQFFKVVPQVERDADDTEFNFARIPKQHNAREAIGFIPWSFGIGETRHDAAWQFLNDGQYFKAQFGPTTVERNHPRFMEPSDTHECLWNGPSWPFSTTQTLNGIIKTLQSTQSKHLQKSDFWQVIKTYAKSHYRQNSEGKTVNWIDENIHPDTGRWLSRDILEAWEWRADKGGYERGKDYNHSAFCDLIIRGICGITVNEENHLIIKPLVPAGELTYFLIEDVPYKDHKITVGYDCDGTRYHKGSGIWVEVDGLFKGFWLASEEIKIAL